MFAVMIDVLGFTSAEIDLAPVDEQTGSPPPTEADMRAARVTRIWYDVTKRFGHLSTSCASRARPTIFTRSSRTR